jgi:hypothetical protein
MTLPTIPDFDLADHLAGCANALFGYRVKNDATLSPTDWDDLRNAEHELLKRVVELRASGVGQLADLADAAKPAVSDAIGSMNTFIERIADAKKAISVAAAAVGLAGAVITGDVGGIVAAAKALEDAATA